MDLLRLLQQGAVALLVHLRLLAAMTLIVVRLCGRRRWSSRSLPSPQDRSESSIDAAINTDRVLAAENNIGGFAASR
jgi:hypothetical protein